MPKVLIVDDDPDVRSMVQTIMNIEGYETQLAVDGQDFLDKVSPFNPDVVTLDVMMPGLNTWEILSYLHEMQVNPKVILLTIVRYSNSERQKLFEMGNVVEYIQKPFDIDDLKNAVRQAVEVKAEV